MIDYILPLIIYVFIAAITPGPNNTLAFYNSFNFGIKKSIHLPVAAASGASVIQFICCLGIGSVFIKFPIIQNFLKFLGFFYLIYLAYKISFSKSNSTNLTNNPVKFIDIYLFQFINPKGVVVAIITITTFVDSANHFLIHSLWVVGISFFFACFSISFWTLLGKFLRKFATNEKFIKIFNYVMSVLLVGCIITFYI